MSPAGRAVSIAVIAIAGLGCSSKARAPQEHVVAIRAMKFEPAVIEVAVGDSIVWTNEDIVPHTVTATGTFDSQQLTSKQQWRYTVMRAGDVSYTCTFHPTMSGKIRTK